jgi:lipoprotein-anchoring transpeptidase ErfK/SrfK
VTLLAGVAALFTIAPIGPSDAQFRSPFDRDLQVRDLRTRDVPVRRKATKRAVTQSKKDAPIRHPFGENMPKGPLQLIVSLSDQRAFLYSNGVRVGETKVSSGTASHPTPTGVFSIIQKNRWHRSNLYGDAPMFYMHRLTWSGIALHEGHLPGFAASHGCIRMPTEFVSRLWSISRMGMRVVVARNQVAPREFSHAKLFNPAQKPDTTRVSSTQGMRLAPDTVETGLSTENLVRVAEALPLANAPASASDAPDIAAGAAASGRFVPEIAGRVSAEAEVDAGIDAAAAAREAAAPAQTVPQAIVTTEVPPAPAAPSIATTEPVTPVAPVVAAPVFAAEPVTTSTVTMPLMQPAPPAAPAGASRTAEPAAAPAATPAAPSADPDKPALDADELRLPRPSPLRTRSAEPAKLNGQVAVFVSRKEKRVFVRHAFVPLFDMPVEIANPDKPFGTHTYTALERVDGGMRWNVISLAPAGPPPVRSRAARNPAPKQQKNAKGKAVVQAPAVPAIPVSDAGEALDRVTFPPDAIERISELLIPGSSLIISDEGLGRETGRYTEFIVETRH